MLMPVLRLNRSFKRDGLRPTCFARSLARSHGWAFNKDRTRPTRASFDLSGNSDKRKPSLEGHSFPSDQKVPLLKKTSKLDANTQNKCRKNPKASAERETLNIYQRPCSLFMDHLRFTSKLPSPNMRSARRRSLRPGEVLGSDEQKAVGYDGMNEQGEWRYSKEKVEQVNRCEFHPAPAIDP